jgi:rubrerythrin
MHYRFVSSAIAEAAYRATVQAGGRGQTSLTIGWEALGLDKETATRIFDEEKKEGFVTARETMYGLQTQKYDKSGNRITDDGKVANSEDAKNADTEGDSADDDDDDDAPTSNVYECSECGYTLFIAQGRESKFFGPSFKCPECGAPKDKFKGRNIEEEDA